MKYFLELNQLCQSRILILDNKTCHLLPLRLHARTPQLMNKIPVRLTNTKTALLLTDVQHQHISVSIRDFKI